MSIHLFCFFNYRFSRDSRYPKKFKKCKQETKSEVLPVNQQYNFCLSGNHSIDVTCITH